MFKSSNVDLESCFCLVAPLLMGPPKGDRSLVLVTETSDEMGVYVRVCVCVVCISKNCTEPRNPALSF